MSLRSRIVALVACIFLVGLGLGAIVAGYHAKQALTAELDAALLGGEQTVHSAFEDLPGSDHQSTDARHLIATFDGNRHIQARLLDMEGGVVQTSDTTVKTSPAPAWFVRLLGRAPGDVEIRAPKGVRGYSAILLKPTPAIDAAAAWQEFSGVMMVLATSAIIGLVLVYLAIGAALRPVSALAAEFARIGSGDFSGRVQEKGPTDLVSLQKGFNVMAGQLAASLERNRHLTDQLMTIQDEERAEIARDLHDEIGPYLFSVKVDAELIAQSIASGDSAVGLERIRSIRSAVDHMQSEVRGLLGRLRPARVTEFGLNAALRELADFWAGRYADLNVELSLVQEENLVPEPLKEAAYRIAQEAANNAVRHAQPKTLRIVTELQNASEYVIMVSNDGAAPAGGTVAGGYGLTGMRERVAALGGRLLFGPAADSSGWTVVARLPLPQPADETAQRLEVCG